MALPERDRARFEQRISEDERAIERRAFEYDQLKLEYSYGYDQVLYNYN